MTITRRDFMLTTGALGGMLAISPKSVLANTNLQPVTLGVGVKAMSPIVINLVIGEALGFNKEEGFTLTALALGTNANVQVAVDRGEVDFGIGVPSFGLPVLAKGEWSLARNFYQYTYPYKWDVVVPPGSDITSYAGLKGKRIGVSDFGATEYPVTRNVLRAQGYDPDKDFEWISVGNGVPAGVALQRGVIDALAYFDTGFGQIEAAGIEFTFLPRPDGLPLVGGQFLQMRNDRLEKDRDLAVGFGRAVCKSSHFILENPTAGAKAFLSVFPETAPRGSSHDEAVAAVLQTIGRRIKLYQAPYADTPMGAINEEEFRTEALMNGFEIDDFSPFYTNDLIQDIHKFDVEAVQAMARDYS